MNAVPASLCTASASEREAYDKLRNEYDIGTSNLSSRSLFKSSRLVILGFVATIAYTNISASFDQRDIPYFVIIMVSCTLLLFYLLQLFTNSRYCFEMWRHNRDWATTIFGIAQSLRTIALYTLTTAFVTVLLQKWNNNHVSALGALAGMLLIVLVVNVFGTVASK